MISCCISYLLYAFGSSPHIIQLVKEMLILIFKENEEDSDARRESTKVEKNMSGFSCFSSTLKHTLSLIQHNKN